ncbi:MAG: hypothetical protein JJV94_04670 [Sulfurospirillum sp.]|nr:hypothetical protein [Sulfurospirillum sp.]
MRYICSLLVIIFITACGYRPATHYTRDVLGERIYVDVAISREDLENSVLIKDAVNQSVITRLGGKLVSRETADSGLLIEIGSITFSPILYNKSGYITAYKTKVSLDIKYKTRSGNSDSFSTSGEYDFQIDENEDGTTNSIISDGNRFDAIKRASMDALNEFVSQIAMRGIK